jgi:hypothetical protein
VSGSGSGEQRPPVDARHARGVQVGDGGVQYNFLGPVHFHTSGRGADGPPVRHGRPWRVFLSHTEELARYPTGGSFVAAAKRAVERAGHVSVEMDTWTAAPHTPRQKCQARVRGCDVYVGIIGFRWGTPVRDDPARSYTELEFDTASEADLPRLVFLVGDDLDVPVPRAFWVDEVSGRRQAQFRARIDSADVTRATIADPKDVETLLYQALTELAATWPDRGDGPPARGSGDGGGWSGPVWAVPPLTGGEIVRPGLVADLVAALTDSRPEVPGAAGAGDDAAGGAVGLTTRVTGASGGGGFGKTTMARWVAHQPVVRRHFVDGVIWTTLGEDAQGALLAERVNEVTSQVTGRRPVLLDPVAAGGAMAAALAGRRVLLIVDDVWTAAQLAPFLQAVQATRGAAGPSVLVTTRRRSVLPEGCARLDVDAMSTGEATALLTRRLPVSRSAAAVDRLLRLTGRWPVLLGLVNGSARADVRLGASPVETLTDLADQLAAHGPDVLDLTDEGGRKQVVTATLRASLARLQDDERDRYAELAVFGEDVDIPCGVLERYWAHTGGWTPRQVHGFCGLLLDLGLAAEYRLDGGNPRLRLHDVIRAWLRHDNRAVSGRLDALIVQAHRDLVPLDGAAPAWWRLPRSATDYAGRYLWDWLPSHLWAAGLTGELVELLGAPEWLLGKLAVAGPGALESDLALADDPACRAAARVVRQEGYLLAPLEPAGSLTATLASRLGDDPDLAALKDRLLERVTGPHLRPIIALPDLPHPAMRRVLTGHTREVRALAVAPDGSWLASAGDDQTVRIWDPATGQERHALTGHTGEVTALAVAPDGSWLASASDDQTVRIWDPRSDLPVAATRVAAPLSFLDRTPYGLVAAGDRFVYFLGVRGRLRDANADINVQAHKIRRRQS